MDEDPPIPHRLRAGAPGLGAPSASEIEIRALELAKSDGRTEISDNDYARAAAELGGARSDPSPPEVAGSELGKLTTWDDPVDSEGTRAPENALDDEQSVAEQLIDQGIQEADHDSRVAAAEEEDEFER